MSKFDALVKKVNTFKKLADRTMEPGNILSMYNQFQAEAQAIHSTLAETARNSRSAWLQFKADRFRELLGMKLDVKSARTIYDTALAIERDLINNKMGTLASAITTNVRAMGRQLALFEASAKENEVPTVNVHDLPDAGLKPVNVNDLPDAPMMMPADRITAYPPIDKSIQEYLNSVLGTNLKPDGRLGPETRKALQAFRDSRKIPPAISDKLVVNEIRSEMANQSENQRVAQK